MSVPTAVTGPPGTDPRRAQRREIGSLALAIVVFAALVFVFSEPHWLTVDAHRSAPFASIHAEFAGRSVYPALPGFVIVAVLIAVLVTVSGTWVRRLLAVLLLADAATTVAYGVGGTNRPGQGRLDELVSGASIAGTRATSSTVHVVWPVLVAVAAVPLAVCALAVFWRAGAWKSGLSARYEVPVESVRSTDPWRSMDRGEDPTVDGG